MMCFIRDVCIAAFVPPKDTKSLTYFLFTLSHISLIYVLLCYPLMMYYDTLSYWCTHDDKVYDTGWRALQKKKLFCSPFVSLIPPPVFFQLCAYQNNVGTGNNYIYFWCYHLWKITTMLSTWCLYLVPFLVIKKCWNPQLSCI